MIEATNSSAVQQALIAEYVQRVVIPASEFPLGDGNFVFANLSGVAATALKQDVTREVLGLTVTAGADGTRSPCETSHSQLVVNCAHYLSWLAVSQPTELVTGKARILESYERYQEFVSDLKGQLPQDRSLWHQHPDYLGYGSDSVVFACHIPGCDNRLVVRIAGQGAQAEGYSDDVPKHSAWLTDTYVRAMARARKIPRAEYMLAASYEEGVTISEIMTGTSLDQMSGDDYANVTDEDLLGAIITLEKLLDEGLSLDGNPANIFHDPNDGFGFIDLETGECDEMEMAATFVTNILQGNNMLVCEALVAQDPDSFNKALTAYKRLESPELVSDYREMLHWRYGVACRLREIVSQRYQDQQIDSFVNQIIQNAWDVYMSYPIE